MKKSLTVVLMSLGLAMLFISCEKKPAAPLTMDSSTSMKTILNAKDEAISELALKELEKKSNGQLKADDVNVEYILRDKKSQTLAVKFKIKDSNNY